MLKPECNPNCAEWKKGVFAYFFRRLEKSRSYQSREKMEMLNGTKHNLFYFCLATKVTKRRCSCAARAGARGASRLNVTVLVFFDVLTQYFKLQCDLYKWRVIKEIMTPPVHLFIVPFLWEFHPPLRGI